MLTERRGSWPFCDLWEFPEEIWIVKEQKLEQLQNTPQLIYMSLNKNSVYCVMPRSSKPPDTRKDWKIIESFRRNNFTILIEPEYSPFNAVLTIINNLNWATNEKFIGVWTIVNFYEDLALQFSSLFLLILAEILISLFFCAARCLTICWLSSLFCL